MHPIARRVTRHSLMAASSVAAALLLAVAPVAAQDLEDWQEDELRSLCDVVSSARAGEIVALEDPFELDPRSSRPRTARPTCRSR